MHQNINPIRDGLSEYHRDLMQRVVKRIEYGTIGEKTTICCLVLKNDFEVIGTSACVDVKDFDEELGRFYALQDALGTADLLDGYHRQEKLKERRYFE